MLVCLALRPLGVKNLSGSFVASGHAGSASARQEVAGSISPSLGSSIAFLRHEAGSVYVMTMRPLPGFPPTSSAPSVTPGLVATKPLPPPPEVPGENKPPPPPPPP